MTSANRERDVTFAAQPRALPAGLTPGLRLSCELVRAAGVIARFYSWARRFASGFFLRSPAVAFVQCLHFCVWCLASGTFTPSVHSHAGPTGAGANVTTCHGPCFRMARAR